VSRSAAVGDMDDFRQTLARSLGMIFLLTIPSSVGLAVLGDSMIAAVYQGGKFRAYDTHQTALALSCYAVGLAGYAAIKVLAPAFYALNDARTPMIVSLLSILVNIAAASSMVKLAGLGHAGLALSTSLVALFSSIVLFEIIRRRIGGLQGRRLTTGFLKITAASGLMGAACMISSHLVQRWMGVARLARVIDLAVSVPLGLIFFLATAKLFHLSELESARRALVAPLARRLGWDRVKI
jgi:putative peptidoglycan lipid II flippase